MRSCLGIGSSRTAWAAVTMEYWMKLKILTERRVHSKLTVMDFKRAAFGVFRNLLRRVSWDKAPEGRGA